MKPRLIECPVAAWARSESPRNNQENALGSPQLNESPVYSSQPRVHSNRATGAISAQASQKQAMTSPIMSVLDSLLNA